MINLLEGNILWQKSVRVKGVVLVKERDRADEHLAFNGRDDTSRPGAVLEIVYILTR